MNSRTLLLAALASLPTAIAEEKAPAAPAPSPEFEGQPVFLISGIPVVYPKGVTKAPAGHEGVVGGTLPFAIIKLDGKLVGEVYGGPLKGKPKDEADEMKATVDKNAATTLLKRESANRVGKPHEITSLRFDLPSPLGKPWIFHSLYFPTNDGAFTFKLVANEKDFERVLPFFEAMFFHEEFMKKDAKVQEAKREEKDKQPAPEQPGR